eukprot:9310554-Alexandrium_andersonii.AAC.1
MSQQPPQQISPFTALLFFRSWDGASSTFSQHSLSQSSAAARLPCRAHSAPDSTAPIAPVASTAGPRLNLGFSCGSRPSGVRT